MQLSIDVSDLEGEWQTTYYYNYSNTKIVARYCETQNGIKWTISGDKWDQNNDNAEPKKDLMFNSNGKWTITEVIKSPQINFVKVEVYKDSDGLIGGLVGDATGVLQPTTACFAYMKTDDQLLTMFNFTDPKYCPPKFIFFDDVCSNFIGYTVSKCQSGKCATSTDAAGQ